MDLTFTPAEDAFRQELRAWLRDHDPGPEPTDEDENFNWRLRFQRQLHDGGWTGIDWPVEFGGRGGTITESAILFEELALASAPLPANVLGLLLAGPTLMMWGTEEQRERYLPPILSGDEVWCQGFSEPDAGSDLAGLKTRAVPNGNDDWVVTGQKVWTSLAQHSKWCLLLARSDPDAPKHKGLTYFVLDMEQEGVTIRPLRQITGRAEFNELFIEAARIPAHRVIGGVGNGWKVALTTLMNERAGLGFFHQVAMRKLLDQLVLELARRELLDDAEVRAQVADLHARIEILRLTAYRSLSATERNGQPGPEGSLLKWMWSSTNQQLTQFAVATLGPHALFDDARWSFELLRARGNTIEGGTTEILKNIVAERVLGLPKGR